MPEHMNPITCTKAPVNETDGMHNDEVIYCPVNAYGDCCYCDQANVCHIKDPMKECADFMDMFEGNWQYWESL